MAKQGQKQYIHNSNNDIKNNLNDERKHQVEKMRIEESIFKDTWRLPDKWNTAEDFRRAIFGC